jgi:type I restriction enzyme R subunit
MAAQSEAELEDGLVRQLVARGFERLEATDDAGLIRNLRVQLQRLNVPELGNSALTDQEFARVLAFLNQGSFFDRAERLRTTMHLERDDGSSLYLRFLNAEDLGRNLVQVTNQVTVQGRYINRYDVTILVNGLPLVQIELKRRGMEIKEAFNQVNRYHRHSYDGGAGLFLFLQLFVISNGVNTKYYANNRERSFDFTSFWADADNRPITSLEEFADVFLEPTHLVKMIARYIVLTTAKQLLVLRPYQYYAAEAIIRQVAETRENGYVWHTTGSGKTLTSFKAAQALSLDPAVDQVVFVVDRNDLDTQTVKEFNRFSEGSVDGTNSTTQLVRQFGDETAPLIVTTIQKLGNAVASERHSVAMERQRRRRIVFIFDECHRSQFGTVHKQITKHFEKAQLFGFTGTPIFADNALGTGAAARTTADLFGTCLHKYVITDAIRDQNVLKFSVEYVGRYVAKEGSQLDIDVEAIDKSELLDSPQRLGMIVDHIIANHGRKTFSRQFNAVFAVSSVKTLITYMDLFAARRVAGAHDLTLATAFTYAANERDVGADGNLDVEIDLEPGGAINEHSRDSLERYMTEYNERFGTNFGTRERHGFYNYVKDVGERVKRREIDLLIVVNMFLTGFDAPTLNTFFVDKNLRHHGLLQAYSRTNRILNDKKSQGNVVTYRNLKQATDDAIALFSNKDAQTTIFIAPYEDYVAEFAEALDQLSTIAPSVGAVDLLEGEAAQLAFVQAFREVLRLKNVLETFIQFSYDDLGVSEQTLLDYQSKYLDLADQVRREREAEKVSILDDVDFQLDLIRRDDINVDYILKLLAGLASATPDEREATHRRIRAVVDADPELHSKRDLILEFIATASPVADIDQLTQLYEAFMAQRREEELVAFAADVGADRNELRRVIARTVYSGAAPQASELRALLAEKPSILELRAKVDAIREGISLLISRFEA